MSDITIYHNPGCGTSRNVLELIRNSGAQPTVVEYLKQPPDRETLMRLIAAMGIGARGLLRQKGTPYDELGLSDPNWTDEQLVGFMLQHPILINRPIVVTPLGTRLCRPSETVLDILPLPQQGVFRKEDGELVKFTLLTRDCADYLVDRYSERRERAQALSERVNLRSV